MNDFMALAKRIFDLDPYGFRNSEINSGCILEEIAEEIKNNPVECIKYLLDYIDEIQEG